MSSEYAPPGVNTYEGRLATFLTVHHFAKRRSSSTRKRGPQTAQWPHKSLKAEEMALAGFFYDPFPDTLDNCRCFHCEHLLDGWEEDDEPVREHLKHSPSCGFAIMIASARRSDGDIMDAERVEDPLGEHLVAARLATYSNQWPHESKKGWKCKTRKMVAAGFCFEPNDEDEDNVKCYYCGLVLGGWEPKDDPSAEHAKRRPDCNFFLMSKRFALESQKVKGKGRKVRGSTASKISRMSTQSSVTIFSEAPSCESLGAPALEGDSVLTAETSTTATLSMPKGRGKRKASAAAATSRKPSRSQKKKGLIIDESQTEMFSTVETQPDSSVILIEPPPPTRKTRRVASRTEPSQTEGSQEEAQGNQVRKTRQRANTKTKNHNSDNESQLRYDSQPAVELAIIGQSEVSKPSRGNKRTSDGVPKLDSSVIILEQPPEHLRPKTSRPTKKLATMKTKPQPAPEPEPHLEAALEQPYTEVPRLSQEKAPTKAKKGKKATKAVPQTESESGFVDSQTEQAPPAIQHHEAFSHSTNETPVTTTTEPSPTPSTPTPARHTKAITRKPVPALQAARVAARTSTPLQSPQSSDAENKPPSSKPSARRPPLAPLDHQAVRIPLAAAAAGGSTPPAASPSKRTQPVKITSAVPWSPTDVERILLASPVKAAYLSGAADKENLNGVSLDGVLAGDKALLTEVVRRVKAGLTEAQRAMSVEQWVRWNASRQAERLQRECEALVMVFEREGVRAMSVLEGIDAV